MSARVLSFFGQVHPGIVDMALLFNSELLGLWPVTWCFAEPAVCTNHIIMHLVSKFAVTGCDALGCCSMCGCLLRS